MSNEDVIVSLQISNDLLRKEIRNLNQEIYDFEQTNSRLRDDAKRLENTIKIQADKMVELENIINNAKKQPSYFSYLPWLRN